MRTSKRGRVPRTIAPVTWALLMLMPAVLAQENQPTPVPQTDTCTVDPDGTAHITRVVPVPGVSAQGRRSSFRGLGLRVQSPRSPNGVLELTGSAQAGRRKHARFTR
jgi:hypothetical protein